MADECAVRLYRDSLSTPWGFRVQGGADFHTPLIIQRVFTGSPAEGELQRGDIVTGIENYDATVMLHKEAQDLIKSSGGTISLNIRRTGSRDRGQSVGAVRDRKAGGWQQHQPVVGRSGPEFGVQYGGSIPRRTNAPSQQHGIYNRPMPTSHNRQSTASDQYMMDRVSQSLASMDLYSAANRAQDDQDIDYGFTQQSVSERRKAFMNSAPPSSQFHSVPRKNPSSGSASRLRFANKNFDPVFGSKIPEFGWAPSMGSARHGPSSSAGFQQESYLPSMGQGHDGSPILGRSHASNSQNAPSFNRQQSSSQRYSTTVRLSNAPRGSQPVNASSNARPAFSSASAPFANSDAPVLNKQYNTPINMYSTQNIVNAVQDQTGIPVNQIPSNSFAGNGLPQDSFSNSPVYKMVQEQDHKRAKVRSVGPRQQPAMVQKAQPPAWNRQESEVGVSEF